MVKISSIEVTATYQLCGVYTLVRVNMLWYSKLKMTLLKKLASIKLNHEEETRKMCAKKEVEWIKALGRIKKLEIDVAQLKSDIKLLEPFHLWVTILEVEVKRLMFDLSLSKKKIEVATKELENMNALHEAATRQWVKGKEKIVREKEELKT